MDVGPARRLDHLVIVGVGEAGDIVADRAREQADRLRQIADVARQILGGPLPALDAADREPPRARRW